MTGHELLGKLELLGPPKSVLIIEDQVTWLQSLTQIQTAHGHSVVSMSGVVEVTQTRIAGLDERLQSSGAFPDPREIDVVFLDYHFAGLFYNGATFLTEFRKHSNALVLGMSSDRGLNDQMLRLGATMAIQKNRLKSMLLSGQ